MSRLSIILTIHLNLSKRKTSLQRTNQLNLCVPEVSFIQRFHCTYIRSKLPNTIILRQQVYNSHHMQTFNIFDIQNTLIFHIASTGLEQESTSVEPRSLL